MTKPYCHLISHGVSIEKDCIRTCCLTKDAEKSGRPILIDSYDINNFSWKNIFDAKKKQIEKFEKGELNECKGCYAIKYIEKGEEEQDSYISYINLNHWTECNSNCIYCSSYKGKSKNQNNVYPILKELINSNKFQNVGEITFQGGEPTLLEEINELLILFADNNIPVRVHSSGIKYNENLHKSIQKELASIIVSIDSGTRETYKKIKKVDQFDQVYKNLKKYAENQSKNSRKLIKAKYIIIPGYNDSLNEIDKFLSKMKKIGITSIIIDIEAHCYVNFNGTTPLNMQVLIDYFKFKTNKLKLELEYYDSARYFESQRTDKAGLPLFSITYLIKYLLTKKDFKDFWVNYQ